MVPNNIILDQFILMDVRISSIVLAVILYFPTSAMNVPGSKLSVNWRNAVDARREERMSEYAEECVVEGTMVASVV